MPTAETVIARAHSAVGHAILYWIGQGGKDPAAALPSNPVQVACVWAGLDVASRQALAPLAAAMGIDVHDPDLVRDACDCSGFVCWALGFARLAPGLNGVGDWINTDSIWADATGRQKGFQRIAKARPGAICVYPRKGSHEPYGHVGIVVATGAGGEATRIVHCSADNIRTAPHDAIKATSMDKFIRQPLSVYAWCRDVT